MSGEPKRSDAGAHRMRFDATAFQLAKQGRLTHHGRTSQLAPPAAPDTDEQRAREAAWEAQLDALPDAREDLIATGAVSDAGAMSYRAQLPVEPSVLRGPAPRRDRRPALTRAAIEETRDALRAEGKPSGERSIALRLGVTRDVVRWTLGKDR